LEKKEEGGGKTAIFERKNRCPCLSTRKEIVDLVAKVLFVRQGRGK